MEPSPDSAYLAMRQMPAVWNLSLKDYDAFIALGDAWRGKDNVVLDCRGNGGGTTAAWELFIGGLFDLQRPIWDDETCFDDMDDLVSPVTVQLMKRFFDEHESPPQITGKWLAWYEEIKRTPVRRWHLADGGETDLEHGFHFVPGSRAFAGKFIMLVDNYSASATENIIPFSRHCLKAIVLGENTVGCIGSGAPVTAGLPHSGFRIDIPTSLVGYGERLGTFMFGEYVADGLGFDPDYWIYDEAELNTTLSGLCGADFSGCLAGR